MAISIAQLPVATFVHSSYFISALYNLYSVNIVPIDVSTLLSEEEILPPAILKKSGRPRTLRIRSRGEVSEEKKLCCSICMCKGHNARTCLRRQKLNNYTRPLVESQTVVVESLYEAEMTKGGIVGRKKREIKCKLCGKNHYKKTLCKTE